MSLREAIRSALADTGRVVRRLVMFAATVAAAAVVTTGCTPAEGAPAPHPSAGVSGGAGVDFTNLGKYWRTTTPDPTPQVPGMRIEVSDVPPPGLEGGQEWVLIDYDAGVARASSREYAERAMEWDRRFVDELSRRTGKQWHLGSGAADADGGAR